MLMVASLELLESFRSLKKVEKLEKAGFICQGCGKEGIKPIMILLRNGLFCRKCLLNRTREKTFGSLENAKKHALEERIKTNIKKFGVSNPFHSSEKKEKSKRTLIEKYGVDNASKATIVQDKKKKTFLKHYGVENPFEAEEIKKKIKETCIKKYGFKSHTQTKKWKEQISMIAKNRSNEEWHQMAIKSHKKYYFDNLYFDSIWEIIVYRKFKREGKSVKRGPVLKTSSGKRTLIDFEVDGKLYEVKSSRTIKYNYNFQEKCQVYLENDVTVICDCPIEGIKTISISSFAEEGTSFANTYYRTRKEFK
jgi:hypothetical protein